MCVLQVILNSTTILASAGITNANSASLAVGGVQVGATVVAVLLMDRAGRRTLLLVSSIGMALTITLLGVVFYYKVSGDRQTVREKKKQCGTMCVCVCVCVCGVTLACLVE